MKKRKFTYYLKMYVLILSQTLKCKMSYKEDFILSICGILATNLAGFASFWIIFQNFSYIGNWSYDEMLYLYGFSLIALTPCQCIFENNWMLSLNVYKGDFIRYCFRPINIFFYYISEDFDLKGIGQLVFGIVVLAHSWKNLSLPFSFFTLCILLVNLLSASLFQIAVMNITAASCFWLINTGGLMLFVNKLGEYSKYPMTIFNKGFRFVFTFIVPIGFIAYFPSLIFIRPDQAGILTFLMPVLGGTWAYLSYKIWMKGALSYTGTGS